MSELVVFVFRGQHRAPDVLHELRRHKWERTADLDNAVAVTLDDHRHAKVHLSLNLSTGETTHWARIWGSLLAVTLFLPLTEVIVEAADRIVKAGSTLTRASWTLNPSPPDSRWWRESLPYEFLRDVSAMVEPGYSAIFMLLRTQNLVSTLKQLRGYGEIFLHTTLDERQDEELKAMLSTG